MVTKVILICIAVAAAIVGGIFYYTGHALPATVIEQAARDGGADYSVGIKYPFFVGVSHEKDLNAALWQLLMAKKDDFKKAVRKRNPGAAALANKSGFYVEYTMVVFNPQLVTVRLKITSYLTGDDHPVTTLETFSYDLVNNSIVSQMTP